ncbi:twin-arginine translocase TatA/TatE family subunit [Streptomyces sp. PDY-4]|jgi:sec-independent protein translocase protein TatA|uniref:twin-arginine translocase TatA/TatE family subunit n=1 Tax=Streptomyces TaxID=1883 RepID=UPI00114F05ED|nr:MULTISPECIES: twin-arginine translocase TatA/TatE family subunit [unclassified Streptomyces]QKW03951.1 twin-arginine translocase TatA/TatE family subunit [Streptomyces sp. NA02536]TQL18673.1 sec-independent protein translocase protein TatA [Streptomyces sp. SLBN-134]
MFGLSELAVVLVVIIAVLAAKRLPDLVRSAGKSARILKAEARAMKDQDRAPETPETPGTPRIIQGETLPPSAPASGSAERAGDTPPEGRPAR